MTHRWIHAASLILVAVCFATHSGYVYGHHGHAEVSDPGPPVTALSNIGDEYQIAGPFTKALRESVRKLEREGISPKKPDPPVGPHVPLVTPGLDVYIGVTVQAIKKIADFAGSSVELRRMIQEIGYSPPPAAAIAFEKFPAERILETACYAAENAQPGGSKIVLARLRDMLAPRYEGVPNDPLLRGLPDIPPDQPIGFVNHEPDLAPPMTGLARETTDIIIAILRYRDSGLLEGMYGILVNHLHLDPDVSYNILRRSASDVEAFARGFNSWPPDVAKDRVNAIIKILQQNYPSARDNREFNEFISMRPVSYQSQQEIDAFGASVLARIEQETRIDAQAMPTLVPEALRPTNP